MHFIANVSVFSQEAHNTCFSGDSDSKESTCNVGDLGSVPGLEGMATRSGVLA